MRRFTTSIKLVLVSTFLVVASAASASAEPNTEDAAFDPLSRPLTPTAVVSPAHPDQSRYAGDVIVFTANQSWLSRIYVLRADGSVLHYFEYEYYIFSDFEVVNNEVYAIDWVAPCLYKVDIETGALEQIVVDISLIYMYDVAWDGTYFYCKEFGLNRYEFDGAWAGSVSFGETVRGSAWDGEYYWTLNDVGQIKCWDISAWPSVVEIPENAFAAPSAACRGLWYDGQHFWTAESIDGVLGDMIRFEHGGAVVWQRLAPAFKGYAACMVTLGLAGDVDGDGDVDLSDLAELLAVYGTCTGDSSYNPEADFDDTGCVDLSDLASLLANYGS